MNNTKTPTREYLQCIASIIGGWRAGRLTDELALKAIAAYLADIDDEKTEASPI